MVIDTSNVEKKKKKRSFNLRKARSKLYPAQMIMTADYADGIA